MKDLWCLWEYVAMSLNQVLLMWKHFHIFIFTHGMSPNRARRWCYHKNREREKEIEGGPNLVSVCWVFTCYAFSSWALSVCPAGKCYAFTGWALTSAMTKYGHQIALRLKSRHLIVETLIYLAMQHHRLLKLCTFAFVRSVLYHVERDYNHVLLNANFT